MRLLSEPQNIVRLRDQLAANARLAPRGWAHATALTHSPHGRVPQLLIRSADHGAIWNPPQGAGRDSGQDLPIGRLPTGAPHEPTMASA